MKPSLIHALLAAAASTFAASVAQADMPDSVAALYSAEANYLDQTQRELQASTRIQEALERGLMPSEKEQDTAKARSARSQLNWGMHYLPSAIYSQLVDRPKPHKVDDQVWLDLAIMQYRRGYWGLTGAVEHSLSRIHKRPKRDIRGQRTMIRSGLYLKQGRYAAAQRSLSRYRGSFHMQPFAEFNQAIALLKQNNAEEGGALLNKVGNLRSDDDDLLALRDLANYTLGNWFLNHDKAGTAIPILKKVRVEGPYSNKALLSLGWAYLSSTGKLQRVEAIFSPRCLTQSLAQTGTIITSSTAARGCTPGQTLRIENLGKKEQDRLQRAMTAWQIVQERNPLFPGVQETLMALPYALDQLGYTHVAEAQYKKAIKSLQYEAGRINDGLDVIHAGQLLQTNFPSYEPKDHDQRWDLNGLNISDKLDARMLYQLYSQHEFYEALVNYRQLRQLQTHIANRIAEATALTQNPVTASPSRMSQQNPLMLSNAATSAPQQDDNNGAGTLTRKLLGQLSSRGLSTSLSSSNNKAPQGKGSKLSVWMTHNKTSSEDLKHRSRALLKKAVVLQQQIDNLAAKHAGYLAMQNELELNIQLDRVNTYMAQAQLSLGRIHDRQADLRIQGEDAEAPREIDEIDFNPLFKVERPE